MRKVIFVILILLLGTGVVFAQGLAKVGTTGYQFLKIAMDARGQALGDAVAPMLDDSRAVFWNPALLVKVQGWSASFTHTEYLADMNLQAFSVAYRYPGIGTFGLFGNIFDSGDMEETTEYSQSGTGRMFQATAYSFGVSYARSLTDKFSIGANFKYINEDLTNNKLDEDNSTGAWAFDVGMVYYPGFDFFESLRLVMNVRNFGPEIQLSGSHVDFDNGQVLPEEVDYSIFQMPLTFNFGVGWELFQTESNVLTAAVLMEHPNDNLERFNTGLEYWWNQMFSLRGGYVINHDSRSLSGGVGFKLATFDALNIKLDYAYVDYGILDMTQFFTVAMDW